MDPIQLSIKIPKPFFTKLEKHNVIFFMETKKNLYKPINLKKEKQSWSHYAFWFQTMLQSYSHQNRLVMAQ